MEHPILFGLAIFACLCILLYKARLSRAKARLYRDLYARFGREWFTYDEVIQFQKQSRTLDWAMYALLRNCNMWWRPKNEIVIPESCQRDPLDFGSPTRRPGDEERIRDWIAAQRSVGDYMCTNAYADHSIWRSGCESRDILRTLKFRLS